MPIRRPAGTIAEEALQRDSTTGALLAIGPTVTETGDLDPGTYTVASLGGDALVIVASAETDPSATPAADNRSRCWPKSLVDTIVIHEGSGNNRVRCIGYDGATGLLSVTKEG